MIFSLLIFFSDKWPGRGREIGSTHAIVA